MLYRKIRYKGVSITGMGNFRSMGQNPAKENDFYGLGNDFYGLGNDFYGLGNDESIL